MSAGVVDEVEEEVERVTVGSEGRRKLLFVEAGALAAAAAALCAVLGSRLG